MLTPDPIAFSIGSIRIHWYGICIVTGVLLGALLSSKREKLHGLPKDTTVDMLLLALPVSVICSRIYYVIFRWQEYANDPISALYFWNGGLAIYGALIGGVLSGALFAWKRKISFLSLIDCVAPSLALGQCIGRWGNFFNQEAYGVMITAEKWQFFPAAVWIESEGNWFAATFFYESASCFVICIILLLYDKFSKKKKAGDVFCLYAVLYALERSLVEGLRLDSLYLGSFRVSQLLSVIVVVCGVVIFIKRHRHQADLR